MFPITYINMQKNYRYPFKKPINSKKLRVEKKILHALYS